MIVDKISSLVKRKAKYLSFRLRRPELPSLESSNCVQMNTRQKSYGFTFFSILGVNTEKYNGDLK